VATIFVFVFGGIKQDIHKLGRTLPVGSITQKDDVVFGREPLSLSIALVCRNSAGYKYIYKHNGGRD
jgi:hypothetical protein